MITGFLIKKFIKNYDDIKDKDVRNQYGILSVIVGIMSYVLLFIIKFTIGISLGSFAIIADSIHNFVDAAASLASFIGFKMSSKPADSEHPFGHGRIEYISALVVSFIIFLVGYEFLKISLSKIISPSVVSFDIMSLIIICITVLINIWQYLFYKKIGKKINSKSLLATSQESLNDIMITIGTIISIIFTYYTGIIIDGYVGVLISVLILYFGYSIAKDIFSVLIGESATIEFVKTIKDKVLSYDGILGVHDIIVHNYGPNNSMVILHAEVPNELPIDISHGIIDKIERELGKELGIGVVIHMDPINLNDKRMVEIINKIENYKKELDFYIDVHDFKIIDMEDKSNVIFEVEIPHDISNDNKELIKENLTKLLKDINSNYNVIIEIEYSYVKRN